MGCTCNELNNTNCFCQCEDLSVPVGPQGVQGIQGVVGPAGVAGVAGTDGDNAFAAELTNDAAVFSRADLVVDVIGVTVRPTTTFKLREGETAITLSLVNATFTPGGAITAGNYTTSIVGGNILVVVDKWDATVRPNTYGYIDIAYLYNAVTYTKRFDVVCVSDGSTFLVGETDPAAVVDPIEGNQLLDVTGALLQYQGGAWVEVLNINRTETKPVVLTGALYTLNLTSSSERIVSITGTGTVNNNITIALPAGGCAAGTEFRVAYNASMTAGTGAITVFGMTIPVNLYTEQLSISALYNGTTWIVTFNLSEGAAKATGNVYFSIVPTVGAGLIRYIVPVSFDGEITYIIEYPDTTDKSIGIDMGEIAQNLGTLITRKVHILFKRMPVTSPLFTSTSTVNLLWTRNGNPEYYDFVSGIYDNVSVGYFLERATGLIVPSTAILQFREVHNARIVVDYDESSNITYNHMIFERTATELYYYDGANTLLGTDLYK